MLLRSMRASQVQVSHVCKSPSQRYDGGKHEGLQKSHYRAVISDASPGVFHVALKKKVLLLNIFEKKLSSQNEKGISHSRKS